MAAKLNTDGAARICEGDEDNGRCGRCKYTRTAQVQVHCFNKYAGHFCCFAAKYQRYIAAGYYDFEGTEDVSFQKGLTES